MAVFNGKGIALAASIAVIGIMAVPLTAPSANPESAITVADEDPLAEPRQKLEDVTRSLLSMLEMMIGSIPLYQAPEILENGDIIIRRVRPEIEPELPKPRDDGDAAQT